MEFLQKLNITKNFMKLYQLISITTDVKKYLKKYNLDEQYVLNNTEWAIVQNLGFDRIWDSGKIRWKYKAVKT